MSDTVKRTRFRHYNIDTGQYEIHYFKTTADQVVATNEGGIIKAVLNVTANTVNGKSFGVVNADGSYTAQSIVLTAEDIKSSSASNAKTIKAFLDSLSTTLDSVNESYSDVQSNVNDIEGRVTSLEGNLLATDGKVEEIEGQVEVNTGDISSIKSDYVKKATVLDSNTKIKTSVLPDFILGQLIYGGTIWPTNPTTQAEASLSSNGKSFLTSKGISCSTEVHTIEKFDSKYEGIYFVASSSGTILGIEAQVGDWIIATADGFKKIDNTDAVTAVNGRIGNVEIYRGTYSSSVTYHTGDIVTKDGFLAIYTGSAFTSFGKVASVVGKTGDISASQIASAINGDSNLKYLPLAGGTITGNLAVDGVLSSPEFKGNIIYNMDTDATTGKSTAQISLTSDGIKASYDGGQNYGILPRIFTGTTAPSNPKAGDIWLEG